MKPVVLITEKNAKGMIELTEEELKQLIADAYEQGYEDGKKQNSAPIYIPTTEPSTNWRDQNYKPIIGPSIYCGPTTTATGQMPSGLTESHTTPNQNVTLRG